MAADQIHADDLTGGSGSVAAKKDDPGSVSAAAVDDGKRGKERVEINLNAEMNVESMAVVRYDGDGLEARDQGFRVGDIVWGKVKGHPWWPGQVYDPRDASEFALKHRQEGLLVAFFGDGASSWCLPSQLVPFVENFERMLGESPSKGFNNAVEKAVHEISRLVEVNSLCKCIRLETRVRLGRPVATSYGVKAGVPIPEVDVGRLPIPEFEPSRVLAELLGLAKSASFDSLLELAVLKSWVSAFSYSKFGGELCRYSDPVAIEGLEDSIRKLNAPTKGPEVDNDPSSPKVFSAKTDSQIKKQKSVSEILAKKNGSKARKRKSGVVKDGGGGVSSSGKRTTKREDEVPESREKANGATVLKKEVEDKVDGSEDGCSHRERKKSKYLSSPYITNKLAPQVDEPGNTTMDSEDPDFSAFAFDGNLDEKAEGLKKMTFSASDVDMEVGDVVLKIQSAAVDAFYLRKEGHLDSIWGFISAFRSLNYAQGTDYKAFNKFKKASHKRKSMATPSSSRPRRCSSKISSRRKLHAGKPEPPSSLPDDLVSDARAIREKLDTMAKSLESYGSRFSAEAKSSLKDEMQLVVEKVETVTEKVRSMAENASPPIGDQ